MSARIPAFSVWYQHDGFDPSPFMSFNRAEKRDALRCLRSQSQAWPNTTYRLKKERKTIVRIDRRDIHLPRGNTTRRAREKFRAEMAELDLKYGSAS